MAKDPKKRIPEFGSIEEESDFWENHEVTDFKGEFEEVNEPIVDARNKTRNTKPSYGKGGGPMFWLLALLRYLFSRNRLRTGLRRRSAEKIVAVGDPHHPHKFSEVDWDSDRLGPRVRGFTRYCFLRCRCGAEKVVIHRALI